MLKITKDQMIEFNKKILKGQNSNVNSEMLDNMYEEVYQVNENGFYKYKNIYEKAAKMLELISTKKPFEKGNSSTATLYLLTLFEVNGIELDYTEESLNQLITGLKEQTLNYNDCLEWILFNRKMTGNFEVKLLSLYPDVYQRKRNLRK